MPPTTVAPSCRGHGAARLFLVGSESREVRSLASVSRGSLTNAYVAQCIGLRPADPQTSRITLTPFTQSPSRGVTLPPAPAPPEWTDHRH